MSSVNNPLTMHLAQAGYKFEQESSTEGPRAILGCAQVGSLTGKWHFILVSELQVTKCNQRLLSASPGLDS